MNSKWCPVLGLLLIYNIASPVVAIGSEQVTVLKFPNNQSVGRLYTLSSGLTARTFLQEAKGHIEVPRSTLLHLEVNGSSLDTILNLPAVHQVTSLDMGKADIADAQLQKLPVLQNIKWLSFKSLPITDRVFFVVSHKFPQLRSLDVSRTAVRGTGIAALRKLPIESLYIGQNELSNSNIFGEISSISTLKELEVPDSVLTWMSAPKPETHDSFDCSMNTLSRLKRLESLNLSGLPLSKRSLKFIGELSNLKYLRAANSNFDDVSMALLRGKRLSLLNIGNCKNISDKGLNALTGMKSLRCLHVGHTSVSADQIARLKCPLLETLSLRGIDFSARGLAFLRNLHLATLELDGTGIKSGAVQNLVHQDKLSSLTLSYTKVDDASVATLVKLRRLKLLDVSDTAISLQGFRRLKQSLPQCTIIWHE